MRLILKKILNSALLLMPILIFYVGIIVFVDSANVINKEKVVTKTLEIIETGKNVSSVDNFNDRLLNLKYISSLDEAPDTVLLGSSRGKQITTEMVETNGTLFNSGVTGAAIEDVVAIYNVYLENELIPKRIIISIDTWFFDINKNETRWKNNFFGEYNRFVSKYVGKEYEVSKQEMVSAFFKNASEVISPGYFQSSLKSLQSRQNNSEIIEPTDNFSLVDSSVIHIDGSYSYPQSYEFDRSPSSIDERISQAEMGILDGFQSWDNIDEFKRLLFERLVDVMIENGSEVQFIISPYNPRIFDRVSENPEYAIVLECENYLRDFAAERNIMVLGSFDPEKCGIDSDGFIDALHISNETTKDFVEPLKK